MLTTPQLWCWSIASNIKEVIQQRAEWFPVISSSIGNILLIDSQTCVSSTNIRGTLYLAFILCKENNASNSFIHFVNFIERTESSCVWTAKTEQLRLLWDNQNKLFRIKKKKFFIQPLTRHWSCVAITQLSNSIWIKVHLRSCYK